MKERKNVTWRVAEHSEHKKINKWLDKQRNIQESIANIVLHMIDQYGYVNITDYEVQKQLYGKNTDISQLPMKDEKENGIKPSSKDNKTKKSDDILSKRDESTDDKDIYAGVDRDNI